MEHYTPEEMKPRQGFVHINGFRYPAEQQAPDQGFRKRATRYLMGGVWSEWCKDDHDIFTPAKQA